LTSLRFTERHAFIFTQVRRARHAGTPAAIIAGWNFLGFFHFASCIERSGARIHGLMRSNNSLNCWARK